MDDIILHLKFNNKPICILDAYVITIDCTNI